jgi:glucose-1-phosphatase
VPGDDDGREDGTGSRAPVDAVLFDLGGVLVRLSGVEEMRRLSGIASEEEIVRRWLGCRWVRRFESGRCTAEDFAAGLISDWGLPVTAEGFLESFGRWPQSLFAGARKLVADTSSSCRVGCLSNTNELHWEVHLTRWRMDELFEQAFLSYRLGLVKPDAAIFRRVVDALGVPAERVVLLDDNQPNVDGAAAVGLRAVRVRGPEEARDALGRLGVLPPRSPSRDRTSLA